MAPQRATKVGSSSVESRFLSFHQPCMPSAPGKPFHTALPTARPATHDTSPSSPWTANLLQKMYETREPMRAAASVPASDFFSPKSVPEKGSFGVCLPNKRPKILAVVSTVARTMMLNTAMSVFKRFPPFCQSGRCGNLGRLEELTPRQEDNYKDYSGEVEDHPVDLARFLFAHKQSQHGVVNPRKLGR